MRKFISLILALTLCLTLASCGDSSGSDTDSQTDPSVSTGTEDDPGNADVPNAPENTPEVELTPEEYIDASLRAIVEEYYSSTDITNIAINENHGTEDDGDYIALVYLTWNVKNKPDTTKQMLSMYSEDFAARIGTDIQNVSEFTVFWTVPYYSEVETAVKYTYARVEGGMIQTDCLIGNILN